MDEFKNPHNFKLSSDKLEPIDNSPMIRIGLAMCGGRYYAAAVDPGTKKNYVLYANIRNQGAKFGVSYEDISDQTEHNAVSDYFLKVGVFEMYYRSNNWIWSKQDGKDSIPPWFKGKMSRLGI